MNSHNPGKSRKATPHPNRQKSLSALPDPRSRQQRKKEERAARDANQIAIQFGSHPQNCLLYDHLKNAGIMVSGASGGGKTSSMIRFVREAFKRKIGGVFISPKSSSGSDFKEHARQCNYLENVIDFGENTGHRYSPLAIEAENSKGKIVSAPADLLNMCFEVADTSGKQGGDSYWGLASSTTLEDIFTILYAAYETISLSGAQQFLLTVLDHKNPDSFAGRTMAIARTKAKDLSPNQRADLFSSINYFTNFWCALSDGQRNGIEGHFLANCRRLLRSMTKELMFSEKASTFTANSMREGKWICTTFDPKVYGETGRILSALTISHLMMELERHQGKDRENMVMLFLDEFHLYCTKIFSSFLSTCREANVLPILLSQSRTSLDFGLNDPSVASNLWELPSIHFTFATFDEKTTKSRSASIGSSIRVFDDVTAGNMGGSIMQRHQETPNVLSSEFSKLARPSPSSPYAEAIVTCAGKTWINEQTGAEQNFLKVKMPSCFPHTKEK